MCLIDRSIAMYISQHFLCLKNNHYLGMLFLHWKQREWPAETCDTIAGSNWNQHMALSHMSKLKGNRAKWHTSATVSQSKVGEGRKNCEEIIQSITGNLITKGISLISLWYCLEANKMLSIQFSPKLHNLLSQEMIPYILFSISNFTCF